MATLKKAAQAGTLESSDMQVSLSPVSAGSGITIKLVSPTLRQYGAHMKAIILGVLNECGVTDAELYANDKGAVDFVIAARVKTAVQRATEA